MAPAARFSHPSASQVETISQPSGLHKAYLNQTVLITDKAEPVARTIESVAFSASKPAKSTDRPDIEWIPSYKTYRDRVNRLSKIHTRRPKSLPEGWPVKVEGPRVWTGADFEDTQDYLFHLSAENVLEVEAALVHFHALPGDNGPDQISKETFPLPTLGPRLFELSKSLHSGIGFGVIRGLKPDRYSPLDNVLLYVGITSYVAEVRGCQDYDGRMIVHIKDIHRNLGDFGSAGPFSPYTSRAIPFHTDRCDILAMYALDVSAHGGESLLASAATVYNEIAATRPDVIHVLADPSWVFDEFNDPPSWHIRQLLHNFDGHGPGFCYSRRPLTGSWFSPHSEGIPNMTELQAEALDLVHFTAEANAVTIKLEVGDIELFNNFGNFHARNGFVDGTTGQRHMIRLWLKNRELAWKTPEPLLKSSWEIFGDSEFRAKPIWDIHKSPPQSRNLHRRMSCH